MKNDQHSGVRFRTNAWAVFIIVLVLLE